MILVKMFVDDKSYDTEDGYNLICTDEEIGLAVQLAVKNGFKDIRIYEPRPEERLEYIRGLREDDL